MLRTPALRRLRAQFICAGLMMSAAPASAGVMHALVNLGLSTTKAAPNPEPVDGSHEGPRHVAGVGKVYPWMVKNMAKPEVNDPAWVKANALAKQVLKNPPAVTPAIRLGATDGRKRMALTIDDGPHEKWTPKLLDLLDQVRVKATFFVVGKMVRKNPELLREIHRRGHEVANHTFSHIKMSENSEEVQLTEYLAANLVIQDAIGVKPTWARPPGGQRSRITYMVAAYSGLKTSLWTCDPLDYAFPGEKVLMARMRRGVKPGAVFLLHSGSPDMMNILPEFVAKARMDGYEFVTQTELFQRKP